MSCPGHRSPRRRRKRPAARPYRRRVLLGAVVLTVFACFAPPAIDGIITVAGLDDLIPPGQLTVIDGDTLRSGKERLRIIGIDACEIGQPIRYSTGLSDCGADARKALAHFVGANPLRCSGTGSDRYARRLVRCNVNGHDVGESMILAGQAHAAPYGAHLYLFRYAIAQLIAKIERKGLHGGTSDHPTDWRRAN